MHVVCLSGFLAQIEPPNDESAWQNPNHCHPAECEGDVIEERFSHSLTEQAGAFNTLESGRAARSTSAIRSISARVL